MIGSSVLEVALTDNNTIIDISDEFIECELMSDVLTNIGNVM